LRISADTLAGVMSARCSKASLMIFSSCDMIFFVIKC
jgi:hypothetical protein